MSDYVIAPPVIAAIPIKGSGQMFPVRRIFCVGRNYAEHAIEMGSDPTREPPFYFTKPADALVVNDADMPYPPMTKQLHHEMELVVAIGSAGADISVEDAMGHVVATLEQSRYARPGSASTELAEDIRTVTRSAAVNRPWTQRIRAFFVPTDGIRWWRRSMGRIADAPSRWIDAAFERFPRRG